MSHICPICKTEVGKFLSVTKINGEIRENAECPKCASRERHRLSALYIEKNKLIKPHYRILHIAPEKCIESLIKKYEHSEYLSIDIDPRKAMKQENINKMTLADCSYDFMYCSCVLNEEGVPDYRVAVRELYRVMSYDAVGILIMPVEDKIDFLREVGFDVALIKAIDVLPTEDFQKFGIGKNDNFFLLKK